MMEMNLQSSIFIFKLLAQLNIYRYIIAVHDIALLTFSITWELWAT